MWGRKTIRSAHCVSVATAMIGLSCSVGYASADELKNAEYIIENKYIRSLVDFLELGCVTEIQFQLNDQYHVDCSAVSFVYPSNTGNLIKLSDICKHKEKNVCIDGIVDYYFPGRNRLTLGPLEVCLSDPAHVEDCKTKTVYVLTVGPNEYTLVVNLLRKLPGEEIYLGLVVGW